MALSFALLLNTFTSIVSADEFEMVGDAAPAYADYTPGEKPANLTEGGVSAGQNGGVWSGSGFPAEMKQGSSWAIRMALSSDRTDKPDSNWFATGIFVKDKSKSEASQSANAFKAKPNTTYVFQVKVRSVEGNVKIGLANNDTWGKYVLADHGKDGYQVGKDWNYFNTTLTTQDNSAYKFNYLSFGIVTGKVSDYFIYDVYSMYLAEEALYDIAVEAASATVEQRGKLNLSASLTNQIGTPYGTQGGFNWYVVNTERTEKVSGFTFSGTGANTTMTVDKSVAPGKYVVMAESTTDSKFKKGVEIEVTREVLKDNGSILLSVMPGDEKPSYDVFSDLEIIANNIDASDINWYAVKENRIDVEDKITITPTTGTRAKVEFVDGLQDGTYYLIAESKKDDSKRKMIKIVVNNSTVRETIIKDFNSGSTTAWEANFDKYVVLMGEDSENFKNADKAEILKLIVEQSKVEAFTDANLSELFNRVVILSLYNKNTNGVELNKADGTFNYETELELAAIDTAGVTIYELYKTAISTEGKKKVIADLTGKDVNNLDEFKEIFVESVILNAICYPTVYGFQYVRDILTSKNMALAGINPGKYLSAEDNSGYNKEIARKELTKAELETILAKVIEGGVEEEVYQKPDGDELEYEIPIGTVGTEVAAKQFLDVPETHWGYADVYFLTQIGVISGVSDDYFAPDSLVTREVAAKVICEAFDLKATGEKKNFSDVDPNAWYAEYIDIAASAGVVNGISNDKFGVGMAVTRQDLCVMIVRAMKNANTEITALDFEDSDQIAEYAKQAVSYLSILAVVNGYSDNTFRPYGNCKRVELAKIVSKVINTVDNGQGDGQVNYSSKEELLFGINAVDVEKYATNASVTRAGLANFVYDICIRKPVDKQTAWEKNVINPPVVGNMTNKFQDLDESHLDFNSIIAVVGEGYMEGISANIFAPDIQINLSYAVEVLLNIMGYGEIAKISGGDQAAYVELARSLDLLDGVSGDMNSPARYKDVVKLFANGLHTGVNKIGSVRGKEVVLKSDSSKTVMTEVLKIDMVEGIMTDNGLTSLTGASKISQNKIKVGGVEIVVPEDAYNYGNLLGRNVKVYYDCSVKGVNTLVYAVENSYEKIYTFDLDKFISFDGTTFVYETETGDKTITVNSAAEVIYNDAFIAKYDESLFKNKNGDVTILSVYQKNDYIIVNDYSDFYVSKINADSEKVYNSINYVSGSQETVLNLMKGADYEKIIINYSNGDPATFADIKVGQALSIKLDKVNKIATIIIHEEVYSNVLVKSVADDEITIEDGVFKVSESLKNSDIKLQAGKSYNLYLNKFGYIVNAEEIQITDGKQMGILARTIDNDDEEIYGIKIYDQNKAIVLYPYAERVTVNGERTIKTAVGLNIKDAVGEPIIFTVTEGKVTEITTPEDFSGSDDERGWYKIIEPYDTTGQPVKWVKPDGMSATDWTNYKYKNWYLYTSAGDGPSFGGRFTYQTGITNVYVVPVEEEYYVDATKYSLNTKSFTSHTYVMVDAYAYDKNASTPDVIIAREETKRTGSINIRQIFVVTGITQGLSENEEPRNILQGYKINEKAVTYAEIPLSEEAIIIGQKRYDVEINPSAKSTIYISNTGDSIYADDTPQVNSTVGNIGPRVVDEIGVGDIFRYGLNSDGEIATIAMNYDYYIDDAGHKNDGLSQIFEPWGAEACATYGYVLKADSTNLRLLGKYNKNVVDSNIELVLGAKPASTNFASYDGYSRLFGFPVTSSYKVLFIETGASGKMTGWLGTLDDVISYEDSKTGYDEMIVLSAYKGGRLAAVVYR